MLSSQSQSSVLTEFISVLPRKKVLYTLCVSISNPFPIPPTHLSWYPFMKCWSHLQELKIPSEIHWKREEN